MCGIVGFWCDGFVDSRIAELMALKIQSRGPDDTGIWTHDEAGVALAHRRLSILDLSPAGHQPMLSPCGRYALIYNGEIYNHSDLRIQLQAEGGAFDWRGHSDTETLLAGLRHWGVERCLGMLNGMFAFALWDRIERRLFLARDRMGEKPLYYGRNGDVFLFGSELKALSDHPDWRGEISRDVLALFLRHNYVPSPWSIYQGIYKLPPAHFVVIEEQGRIVHDPQCYWDLGEIASSGVGDDSREAGILIDELDDLVRDAVKRRMVADVPLGAFLSGGYDSSLVVAAMQAQSRQPIRTFSIGFDEVGYNEAHHAKAVAAHLGTEHTELYVRPEEAMAVIPKLPTIYDEPFSDSSQIPTYLVSQLARQHVTVSLSGDGGDELFSGYNRYVLGHHVWGKLRLLPLPVRQMLAWGMRHAPGRFFDLLQQVLPVNLRVSNLADRLPKLAEVVGFSSGEAFYRSLVSHAKSPEQLVIGAAEPTTIFGLEEKWSQLPGLQERMMFLDQLTYLPDDILAKVDRASMALSLEARVPLLDHRLVEFAWQVPTEYKYRNGQGKWLLRQVLHRYVPQTLMERPKMGFGVPIEHWLRGPLREWADALLDEKRLQNEGFFQPELIRKMWDEHRKGDRRWHYHLWDVLMFQAWNEHWHEL